MSNTKKIAPVTDKIELLSQYRREVEEQCKAYSEAIAKNDAAAMALAESIIKDNEAAYADCMMTKVFDELAPVENPVKAAIARYSYPVLRHKRVTDDGTLIGFEVEEADKQIDLVRFCEYIHAPTDWKYLVERFNQLLCLRAAQELKCSRQQIQEICNSYFMSEAARKIDLGETPTSNTQIGKMLQKVFDAILFEDNGKGGNLHRVNSHDVAYLLMTYTRKGRKALSVRAARHGDFHKAIMDVMYRVLCGKEYSMDYKITEKKSKAAPVKEVKAEKPAKKSAKKAEKVSEKTVDSSEKAA